MSLASSLPPLDFERFSQMSARRLEKQVAAMSFSIQRAEEAEEVAQRMAERRYVQAEAWRQLGLKREADVKAARVLLTQPNITLREPVLANEARRETARDSARREEMMRRREAANQALVLRDLRAKAVVHAEKEREVLRKGKEEQHEQLLERTQELEAFRRALKADGAAKKSAEAKQLAALRRAEEAKVAATMDRNEKNREAAERRKMAREKKYEQQKEAELSARKRRDAAYAELRASNEAEEKAKKLEVVWSTAEQFAQRCARDYEEEENRLRLTEGTDAAKAQLERKLRRWQQAAKLTANAKQAYEVVAIHIGKLASLDPDGVKVD